MSAKRRKRAKPGARSADAPQRSPEATRAGAQALFFVALAFVAAHEGFTGLSDRYRMVALWALVGVATLIMCARRRDAVLTDDLCLGLSGRARIGILLALAVCVVSALAGFGDRTHGLFATSTADAALVGGLAVAAAVLSWGGAASATRTMFGSMWAAVAVGAIMFTMAFFTGDLYADAAVFVASIAATYVSQRARSAAFPVIVFAYGAGGAPGAIVAAALYVLVAVYRGVA